MLVPQVRLVLPPKSAGIQALTAPVIEPPEPETKPPPITPPPGAPERTTPPTYPGKRPPHRKVDPTTPFPVCRS